MNSAFNSSSFTGLDPASHVERTEKYQPNFEGQSAVPSFEEDRGSGLQKEKKGRRETKNGEQQESHSTELLLVDMNLISLETVDLLYIPNHAELFLVHNRLRRKWESSNLTFYLVARWDKRSLDKKYIQKYRNKLATLCLLSGRKCNLKI